jgi:hypothetical protein
LGQLIGEPCAHAISLPGAAFIERVKLAANEVKAQDADDPRFGVEPRSSITNEPSPNESKQRTLWNVLVAILVVLGIIVTLLVRFP